MAILRVPITKAGNRVIEIDTDDPENGITDAMYIMLLEEGAKVLLNKGMSKIATKGLEGDELDKAKDAAYAKGLENFEALKAGKVRKGRAATTTADGKKVPGVVLTEARRLAKEVIKDEIRATGGKVSHVEASVITKAANELIATDSSYIEQAAANIAARTAKVAPEITDDAKEATKARLAALGIHESPKLKAAADKAKAERKTQLSAKQAGKAAPRKASQAHA